MPAFAGMTVLMRPPSFPRKRESRNTSGVRRQAEQNLELKLSTQPFGYRYTYPSPSSSDSAFVEDEDDDERSVVSKWVYWFNSWQKVHDTEAWFAL